MTVGEIMVWPTPNGGFIYELITAIDDGGIEIMRFFTREEAEKQFQIMKKGNHEIQDCSG